MNAVKSSTMGNGSYGIYSRRPNDTTVKVWFCGGRIAGKDVHTVQSVCAHSTRREAESCANRPTK